MFAALRAQAAQAPEEETVLMRVAETRREDAVRTGPFFRLRDTVRLVPGARCAALYDLGAGHVYSVDARGRALLESLGRGDTIEEAARSSGVDLGRGRDFLRRLASSELGTFTEAGPPENGMPWPAPPPRRIDTLWLEIDPRCNLACAHCYAPQAPGGNDTLPPERWTELVREAARTDPPPFVSLIGGEPLLFEGLFPLIEHAREAGIARIEVFTNGTLLEKTHAEFFRARGVCAAVSVYGPAPDVHDAVTGVRGSFARTMRAVRLLREAEVPVRGAAVFSRINQDVFEETVAFLEATFPGENRWDAVRPAGRGEDEGMAPSWETGRGRCSAGFEHRGPAFLAKAFHGNSCWFGKAAVTSSGDVLPCVMARGDVCGSVAESSLASVIEGGPLRRLWDLSRDRIETCRDCEYRYVCRDCRVLARAGGRPLHARGACAYDPYRGEWLERGQS
jgi:radical SAM protein with 4Fe4S-binding SPASM domain